MAKLLVHRVPVVVSSEDLHKVISGEFTVEVKVRTISTSVFIFISTCCDHNSRSACLQAHEGF